VFNERTTEVKKHGKAREAGEDRERLMARGERKSKGRVWQGAHLVLCSGVWAVSTKNLCVYGGGESHQQAQGTRHKEQGTRKRPTLGNLGTWELGIRELRKTVILLANPPWNTPCAPAVAFCRKRRIVLNFTVRSRVSGARVCMHKDGGARHGSSKRAMISGCYTEYGIILICRCCAMGQLLLHEPTEEISLSITR